MNDTPEEQNSWKCPICDSEYENPVVIKCGHMFCLKCLEDKINCPICHSEIKKDELIYVYGHGDSDHKEIPNEITETEPIADTEPVIPREERRQNQPEPMNIDRYAWIFRIILQIIEILLSFMVTRRRDKRRNRGRAVANVENGVRWVSLAIGALSVLYYFFFG